MINIVKLLYMYKLELNIELFTNIKIGHTQNKYVDDFTVFVFSLLFVLLFSITFQKTTCKTDKRVK